jgi:peptidoglycan/LPS O-acetylase OafA/YrhL
MSTIGFSFLTAGFGGLLAVVLDAKSGTVLHRLFESRPLVKAGKFSYGLYIVHLAVAFALIPRVVGAWWTKPVYGSFFFANLGFLALAGTASLAIAWLSWHLIEKRALALKRYVPYGTAKSRDTVGR